jgi:MFS family permease
MSASGPGEPKRVTDVAILRTYVILTLLSTLAASFIWGINTLFLLDAGLSITQAFSANAFFTAGQVLFEIPTGVVADLLGRRTSYLFGSATLFVSTLLYYLLWRLRGPFAAWALVSMLLGLGFTFFSGATEAWLVDGLRVANYRGTLEAAFAKGQIASGVAMLAGTLAGGVVAQATNLGVPYLLRSVALGLTFAVAFVAMRDVGFTPNRSVSITQGVRHIVRSSLQHGFRNAPVRWLMLAAPFNAGVGIYAFYAMQPFLLELYGRSRSYAVAGLAAAIVASAQIVGGALVPYAGRVFRTRTTLLLAGSATSAAALALIGLAQNFVAALTLMGLWAVVFAATMPVRQAFLNGLIPSEERATVLSSYNLLGSSGGVFIQPALGRAADAWGYATSYLVGAGVEMVGLPFILLARRERARSDPMREDVPRRS